MATLPPLDPALAGENHSPHVIASICIVVALSTVFAAARLYVRVYMMRKFQFDDFIIVLSVVSSGKLTLYRLDRALTIDKVCGWTSVGFSTAAMYSGSGRHIQTLTDKQRQGAILFTLIGFVPGILSYVLPKMAVVTLLGRLLNPSRSHLIWLWSMCIICLVTQMGAVGIVFGQCQPLRSQWDFSVPADFCLSKWILVHYTQGTCS